LARYCIDASFLLAWPLAGAGADMARDFFLRRSAGDELLAPALLWAETASSLREGAFRGIITPAAAREALTEVLAFPIRCVHFDGIYTRAIAISERLGWAKTYDAIYLATAEYERAELLTLDGGMHGAPKRLGIRAWLNSD
jgi:predicted nucleic acid-binding protein